MQLRANKEVSLTVLTTLGHVSLTPTSSIVHDSNPDRVIESWRLFTLIRIQGFVKTPYSPFINPNIINKQYDKYNQTTKNKHKRNTEIIQTTYL